MMIVPAHHVQVQPITNMETKKKKEIREGFVRLKCGPQDTSQITIISTEQFESSTIHVIQLTLGSNGPSWPLLFLSLDNSDDPPVVDVHQNHSHHDRE